MVAWLLRVLRSPVVRAGFLVVALGLAVAYVVRDRAEIAAAWSRLDAVSVLLALVCSLANVALSGASWRSVMGDLGSKLPVGAASRVFFVGQLGRYIPGSVFQFVAQAELARDHGVPRRRTGSALVVALLVSLTTASLIITGVLPLALHGRAIAGWEWTGWLRWTTPLLLVLLVPAVTNRLLALLLRLARQEPLEHRVTARGLLASAGWAMASWVAVGLQVFVLARAVGSDWSTGSTLALALGGYVVAWMVGFFVVLAPAGAGARELVLGAVLGLALGGGGAAVVVLGSRVLLTLSDLLLAFAALAGHRAELAAKVRAARDPR